MDNIPDIKIDDNAIEMLASETTSMGYTVPGVQKKLSLHLMSQGAKPQLTLVNYPAGYILKPQIKEYNCMPESEHLVMAMADIAGISTVPHALLEVDGIYSYITKRVDRVFEKDGVSKLAMEDFCQLDFRLTEDKYKGSYERCAKIISKYSSRPGIDMTEFFIRLVFCFIIGNSDMHMKNFSLIETSYKSQKYILSPAYDLLPVNIIMPEDTEEFAIPLNGKKRNVRRKDFLIFAEANGISIKAAEKMIDKMIKLENVFLKTCEESYLPDEIKNRFSQLIQERIERLS